MVDEETTFSQLLTEWQELSAGDRKAILRAMTAEQRLALEEALSDDNEEELNAASEYREYSAWLAKLLKPDENRVSLMARTTLAPKPKVRETLGEIHQSLLSENGAGGEPLGLLARAKQAWSDLRAMQ